MGAGKSRAMQWLHRRGYFPLDSFVAVDPDRIRYALPEWRLYLARNRTTAGALTHKEAGYIAELLTLDGLAQGKNVLVDGSLRDAAWHAGLFRRIRRDHPATRIAVIYCRARPDTVLARAERRAEETGRGIPRHVLLETMAQVPRAVEALRPLVDQFVELDTDGASP
ncbi:MAG: zeta toxin family protein, partial [Pseudomonadota bacterium]